MKVTILEARACQFEQNKIFVKIQVEEDSTTENENADSSIEKYNLIFQDNVDVLESLTNYVRSLVEAKRLQAENIPIIVAQPTTLEDLIGQVIDVN